MSQSLRRLAAILFTDMVGYTALMQQDEKKAVTLTRRYVSVLDECVATHGGEILNDFGDGSLCTFSSATAAVRCAMDIQRQLNQEPVVPLRIGLHIGEIFFEGSKVLGDGVNVASRIQSMGVANSILVSSEINSKLKNQDEFKTVALGRFEFKNVDEPVEVFAITNEGLQIPDPKKSGGKLKEKKKSYKSFWLITSLLAVIIFTFVAYRQFSRHSGFTSGEKSIAVLPFENAGAANVDAYISDGITQDIINNLSKIASLQKVIGWFSVKGLKKTTKTVKQIAEDLNVAAILSGTIQQVGEKTHIIAELIDVNTNQRIWGDEFEYEGKDLLSIQSKIASEIVTALKANITPEEKKNLSKHYTENVEAYKYYIRGRTFWNARSRENFDSAEANFKKAIALDSSYALAYAGIADCYLYNYKNMPQLEAIPIARSFDNQALAIDSTLSEGLTGLGFIQHNFDYEWAQSKKTLEKAIAYDPNNATAHLYLGNLLQYTGQTDEGLKEAEKAEEIEPLAYGINWVLGRNYYFARKYDLALKQFEKTLSLAPPGNYESYWSLGLTYLAKKMYPEALAHLEKIPDGVPAIDNSNLMKGFVYAKMGDRQKATALLNLALRDDPGASPYRYSEVYATLGDTEKALDYIEKGYSIRDLHMFWLKIDPAFNPLRNEPRFKALLKKMGLE